MNNEALKIFQSQCKIGNHAFEEVFSVSTPALPTPTIRWCSTCGCIVIDYDVDGHIYEPGGYMSV